MKYLVIATVLATLLFPSVEARSEPIGADKGIHFGAGAVIAQSTYPAFRKYFKNETAAQLCAFGTAFLVSLAKEVADGRRFDSKDLAAGTLGGGSVFLFRIEW